jgi:hypothetical protein
MDGQSRSNWRQETVFPGVDPMRDLCFCHPGSLGRRTFRLIKTRVFCVSPPQRLIGEEHLFGWEVVSLHPAKHRFQVAPFRHMYQERMIRPRTGDVDNLQRAAHLPCGAAERFQEHFFAD